MTKRSLKASGTPSHAGPIEFRILGPLEARVAQRVLALGGTKPRSALAVLLLHANQVVSKDRLIDELWGARPPTTAATALQVHISNLRKTLNAGGDVLLTRPPGYMLALEPDQLDLERFERLTAEGSRALSDGDPASAAASLRAALDLWRGPPLADLAFEPFAQVPVLRLDELRVAAIEARIEAELAIGHHAEMVAELTGLIAEHPLRERLRGQLMIALYRSGRQADALGAYRTACREFVDRLGIEPGDDLRRLERAMLSHDEGLELVAAPDRSILVLSSSEAGAESLVRIAAPLVARRGRALVLTRIVDDPDALADADRRLREQRTDLLARGLAARAAAFVSRSPGPDAVRLAVRLDAELLLVEAPTDIPADGSLPEVVAQVLAHAPCDVAVLGTRAAPRAGPVVVPFGGAEHDWAAIELGAWIARSEDRALSLVGSKGGREKRDASRLLADASLAVQYALGVAPEPVLAEAGIEGLLRTADRAGLLVVGLSARWAAEGLGRRRARLARESSAPVLFVRRGVRPGGMAPRQNATRYTWSVAPAATR